jgi:putative glycosyltransferase
VNLSIVATLYRSAAHIDEFYARVCRSAAEVTSDFELVFVNDGSPDDSRERAQALVAQDSRVRLIDLSRNFGHHRAMMVGLEHARGDLVFLIDSDLEEDPEFLPQFHAVLQRTRVDVVYGVQRDRRGGWLERLTGWLFFTVFNALSDVAIPRNVLTVRLMTRRYVSALVRHRERQTMIAGLWVLTGFEQTPCAVTKRRRSSSSYRLGHRISVLVNSVTSFSYRPLVLIFGLGLGIFAVASAAAAYLIVRRVFLGVMFPGWPSLIVSVWLLGGLNLFCIGVIGIYLAKIFVETKQRPYTIVREVYERTAATVGVDDTRTDRPVLR